VSCKNVYIILLFWTIDCEDCQFSFLTDTTLLTTTYTVFPTPKNIQLTTDLLGRFQLRSDLSQAWLFLTFVSIVQKRVHNLALFKRLIVMIANFHLSLILHCLPRLSYFQQHKIQLTTDLLGRFQLRSDLSQAWLFFFLVSIVQKCVHNLALLNDWLWRLSIFISHWYYIAYDFYRISNTTKRCKRPFWVDSNWDRISHKLDYSFFW